MKRGDSGDAGRSNVFFADLTVGVREKRGVSAVGDTVWSKIESGEAGRSGFAFGKSGCGFMAN